MTDTHEKAITVVEANSGSSELAPVVAAAMAQNPTPETLRELLAVQREWEAGEAKRAFTRAEVGLRRDLPAFIDRDQTVDYTSKKGRTYYTHASLAHVMDEIADALSKHGFSLGWEPSTGDRTVTVTCRLTHTEGHSKTATISAPADTTGNKNPAQAIASTITLLQRYTALSLLGIATADMSEPEERKAPSTTDIDPARNLRAAAAIRGNGFSVDEAEELVGKSTEEWTDADRVKVKRWFDEQIEMREDEKRHAAETGNFGSDFELTNGGE